jgi:hypothetical protein
MISIMNNIHKWHRHNQRNTRQYGYDLSYRFHCGCINRYKSGHIVNRIIGIYQFAVKALRATSLYAYVSTMHITPLL